MSTASVWAGGVVEYRVPDGNEETPENPQRALPRPEEVGNADALLARDLEASPDGLVELIVHNLRQLGQATHAAFLQKLLRGLASIEASEKESIVHWERILARRNELTEKLGRPVSLRTAAVDYFGELHLLRRPILLEYEELEKLRHNAATDPLTGLKNRRMFEEHLGREINRARRYGTSFAMLLLDLRRFKLANDTYGHVIGDEILRSVARASVETIRGSDISCRIGGDEFAILLPQGDLSSAEALAERIAGKFESYARPLAPKILVGVDYGIAIFPEDGEEATKLYQTADRRLYESKHRPSRTPEEPVATAGGVAPEVAGPVREAAGEAETRGPRGLAGSVGSPVQGQAAKVIQPSEPPKGHRRYERIAVEGARRIGYIRVAERCKFIKVLDLSLGGVGLLTDDFDLPESFPARIQIPFLPDNEITLHRVYSHPVPHGRKRVGCSFIPTSQA